MDLNPTFLHSQLAGVFWMPFLVCLIVIIYICKIVDTSMALSRGRDMAQGQKSNSSHKAASVALGVAQALGDEALAMRARRSRIRSTLALSFAERTSSGKRKSACRDGKAGSLADSRGRAVLVTARPHSQIHGYPLTEVLSLIE